MIMECIVLDNMTKNITRASMEKMKVTKENFMMIRELICTNWGKTYTNMCELKKAQCNEPKMNLKFAYHGTCQSPCLDVNCANKCPMTDANKCPMPTSAQ